MYRNNRTNVAILYGAIFSVITANVYSITREEIIKLNPVDLRKAFDKNGNLSGVSHHERNLLRTKLGILSDKDKILKLDKRLNAIGEQRDLIAQKFLETKGTPLKTASPRELMQLTLNRPALDVSKLSSSKLEEKMKNAETANAKYLRNVAKSTAGIIPGVSDVFTAIDIYQNGVDLEIPSFEEPKDWITMSNALAKIKIEQKIAKGSALKKVAGKMGHVATVSDVLLQSVNLVAEGHDLSQSAKDDLMDSYRKGGSFFINSFAKKAIGSSSRYIKNHKVVGNGEMMKTIDAEMLADKKKMRGLLRDEILAIKKAIKELSEDAPKGVGFKNKFQNSLVQMNDNTVSFVLKVLNQKDSTEVMMESLQISLGILNGFEKDFDAIFRVQYEQVFYANLDRELEQLELKETDDLVQSIQNFSAGIRQLPVRRAIAINPESYLGGGEEKISSNVNTGILAKTKNEDTIRHEVVNSQHGGEAETPSTESPVTPTPTPVVPTPVVPTPVVPTPVVPTPVVPTPSPTRNGFPLVVDSDDQISYVGGADSTASRTFSGIVDENIFKILVYNLDSGEGDVVTSNANAVQLGSLEGLSWGSWRGRLERFSSPVSSTKLQTQIADGYWIHGSRSVKLNPTMPSGSVSYQGSLIGSAVVIGSSQIRAVSGDLLTSINFSSSRVSSTINNLSIEGITNAPLQNIELTEILSPVFGIEDGHISNNNRIRIGEFDDVSVSLAGEFYGANYNSIGGSLFITSPDISGEGIFYGARRGVRSLVQVSSEPSAQNLTTAYSAPIGTIRSLSGGVISSTLDRSQTNISVATNLKPFDRVEVNNATRETIASNEHLLWGRWDGQITEQMPGTKKLVADNMRGYWITGRVTPAENIPATGKATYDGRLIGSALVDGNQSHDLTGDFQMNIDFAQRSLSSKLSRVVYHTSSGPVTIIDANGANITGALFKDSAFFSASGNYSSPNRNHKFNGTKILMDGALYGTNADAVGGTFRLLNTYPDGSKVLDANGIFYSTSKTTNP